MSRGCHSPTWGAVLAAALLTAGSALPPSGTSRPGADTEPSIPEPVVELVRRAEQASREGRHDEAAAHIERALGVAPRNAVLWQNLSVVRFRQGRFADAENLALRSIDLAAGQPALQRRNWELIAETRRRRGDEAGAEQAAARARDERQR